MIIIVLNSDAAPWYTCAAVCDERRIKARRDAVVKKMVHDAIAEICGPHFARLWAGDDKADRAARVIGAVSQLVVKVTQVTLKVLFEIQCASSIAF